MFFRPSAVLYAFQPTHCPAVFCGQLVLMLLSFHICLRLSIIFSNFSVFNQIRMPHLFISPIFGFLRRCAPLFHTLRLTVCTQCC